MAKKMYIGVNGVARKVKQPYIGVYQDKEVVPYGLPSGYTALEFIQSDGTQHIDTGFKPNNNTRVVVDCEFVKPSADMALFGARTAYNSAEFVVYGRNGGYSYGYGSARLTVSTSSISGRYTVDANKNSISMGGNSASTSATTFTTTVPIYLFAYNDPAYGMLDPAVAKIYSCQIYDNGTLVRNFVPCKNASGEVGLYDLVNSRFYGNAGTGTLVAGASIPTIPAGDRARKVKAGYIGVNGVARKFFESGIPITNYKVGDTLKLNVNGTLTDFIIVHIGRPSTLYDLSCNGYWLVAKNIYTKRAWSGSNTDYANSSIHTYLNNTFLKLLDSSVQSTIAQVKIPYKNSSGSVVSGSSGLSTKIFLLSGYEIGWTTSGHSSIPVDGANLNFFGGDSAVSKNIAYYNGVATQWWTRSSQTSGYITIVSDNGYYDREGYYSSFGVRPALILPATALVSDGVVIG